MKKYCTGCEKTKDVKEFYKSKATIDGLQSRCKECRKAYGQSYYAVNKTELLAYGRSYRKTKKGQEVKKNNSHNYRKTKKGRTIVRKVFAKYQRTAKGKEANLRATCKRRSIFKRHPECFTLTLEEWEKTLKYFDFRCAYCGKKNKKLVHEHVIALEIGGWHTKENVVPSCQQCNRRKGRKIPFFTWQPPAHRQKFY